MTKPMTHNEAMSLAQGELANPAGSCHFCQGDRYHLTDCARLKARANSIRKGLNKKSWLAVK